MILAAYCDFAAVGIRGNLSPPVLAKNKGTAVFRLVSVAKAKLARACPGFRPITAYIKAMIVTALFPISYRRPSTVLCMKNKIQIKKTLSEK